MDSVKGKKLLVLGSTELISQIVKKAMAMGVYTIVTDNKKLEMAPAKRIADCHYDIDLSDIDSIVKLIKREDIDGVITGFTDSYIDFYRHICKKAGLPCYGSDEAFKIATDKEAFKQSCRDSNLPVIPGNVAGSLKEAKEIVEMFGFPIIMKPSDNSGSRGVIKCENQDNVESCYEYALSYSRCRTVIVEKYMSCDNLDLTYYIEDGEAYLSATSDRYIYVSPKTGSSITSYSVYPSKYTDRCVSDVDDKIKQFIKKYGFYNGMLSINAYIDENSFYFCEMCYRPSGGQHYYLIEHQNHIDQLGLFIEFALNGTLDGHWSKQLETPYFNKTCAVLRIIGVPEKKICCLEGIDTIARLENVIKVYSYFNEGDTIGMDGTTGQVIASVWFYGDSVDDVKRQAYDIEKMIRCEDQEGNNLSRVYLDE